MALTISIDGKGIIANADALNNDTGGTGTGDWDEAGGGSISLTEDTFLYGSSCIAGAYSNKSGYHYFDIGSGNELDFDTAGSEEGQHIFMWIHCPTIGLLETKANKGLAIRLGTDLSNYREYLIAGSDDANGWNGGWRCFVIDPTKAGSVSDTGTYDYGSIRYIGVWIDAAAIAKGDNIFIDQIAVGFGLKITGTSTSGWKDAVDYCTDYANRAWGMLQEREGIYYVYGNIQIGNATTVATTSFTDSGRIIQFGTCEYWSTPNWITSMDIDCSGIKIEDRSATFPTTFTDGVIVGTDNGRSGSVIIGNSLLDVSVDLYDDSATQSLTALYGTTLKNLTGAINSGNNSNHRFYGVNFINCEQFDPVGAPEIRNCIFAETAATSAALIWNANIDIESCKFIANTNGAGIEMPKGIGDLFAYEALTFSGNTYDVENTSSSPITINKNQGSDPTTYEGNTVTYLGVSVTTKITARDISDNSVIEGARVFIEAADNTGDLFYEATVTVTRAASIVTINHTYNAHGLSTGDIVRIKGCDQGSYNIAATINVLNATEYQYYLNATPISPATGSPTSTEVIFNNLTNVSGFVSESRSFSVDQNVVGKVRKSTATPLYKSQPIIETINKDTGLTLNILLIKDE